MTTAAPAIVSPASDPAVRRTMLGGSDMAAILGMSRFRSAMAVWLEKRGLSAPLIATPPMRWGQLLEEPIAKEYSVETGRRVTRWAQTIRMKEHPFLAAHIDRRAKGKGEATRILECKTAGTFMVSDFGEPGTDEIPAEYTLQTQHYMAVTGYDVADLAVLIGGQKFAIYTIPRDDELIATMHAEAARFWHENVETGIPPEVDGSDAWREYAASRFEDVGIQIEVNDTIETLAYQYESTRAQIAALEQTKKEAANRLIVALGEASKAVGRGVKVTHSVIHRGYPNYKAILEVAKVPEAVVKEHTREDVQDRVTVTIKAA